MTELTLTKEEKALLGKGPDQHKYSHGHLLVLSGPRHQTGAARLAARAGLRVGAGLVSLGATERSLSELAAHVTEIMLRPVETGVALAAILAEAPRITALCIGPALRVDRHGADLLRHALESGRKLVVDADAITLLAEDAALAGALHENCVLTPHRGEFVRAWPKIALSDPAQAAKEASEQTGATVLLKGAVTQISSADGMQDEIDSRKSTHASWLATAGSGDVLAGLIAGLLARGADPHQAALLGAKLHVLAAEEAGPGLIAGDLPEALPHLFKTLKL